MGTTPKIMIQKIADVTVVDIQEARLLDSQELEALAEQLYRLVDQLDRKKLIVDFSRVQFLASAAIGVLTNLHKKSAAIKGTLVLCGLRKEIMKVFEIMNLTKLLRFCANEKDALGVFGVTA